jgi:hypothetical protein
MDTFPPKSKVLNWNHTYMLLKGTKIIKEIHPLLLKMLNFTLLNMKRKITKLFFPR